MAGNGGRHQGLVLNRGDLVTVAIRGDYDKPRPALIIQSDLFAEHPSITVLPVTSDLRAAPLLRLTVQPDPENGLLRTSQIMVDKAQTIPPSLVMVTRPPASTLRSSRENWRFASVALTIASGTFAPM